MKLSICTDADVPIEKRSISLWSIQSFCSRLRASGRESINFQACSLPCPPHSGSTVTQPCTTKLKDGEITVNNSVLILFGDSFWEFGTAHQGEILIKVATVMWEEDSLWSWKQSRKHFPIFKQGQLNLFLLTYNLQIGFSLQKFYNLQ